LDVDVNIVEAVQHAFHVYDDLEQPCRPEFNEEDGGLDPDMRKGGDVGGEPDSDFGNIPQQASTPPTVGAPTKNPLLEDTATTPLFVGAHLSCLSATLLILNCLRVHGASNALISELLMLLSKSVLPSINCLPSSEYLASKMLTQLGLAYELIHACPSRCMLFRGVDSEHITHCSKY
jgi:hypothetical protein